MAVALRPLQPRLGILMRRSVLTVSLRAPRSFAPNNYKVQHTCIAQRSKHQVACGKAGKAIEAPVTAYNTEKILTLARQAVKQTGSPQSVVDVTGHGHHMGMDVVWQLKLRADGAFLETIAGKELKFRWGCSGGASASSWEVDDTDVSKPLQLDDNEACLVAAWVKSGLWLTPEVSEVLDIELISDQADELHGTDMPTAGATVAETAAAPAADAEHDGSLSAQRPANSLHQPSGGPSSSDSPSGSDKWSNSAHHPSSQHPSNSNSQSSESAASDTQQPNSVKSQVKSPFAAPESSGSSKNASSSNSKETFTDVDWESDTSSINTNGKEVSSSPHATTAGDNVVRTENRQAVDSSGGSIEGRKPYVMLAVKLKTGKLVNQVKVCCETWQPIALLQPVCGEVLTWHYQHWQEWESAFLFPAQHIHLTPSGGNNSFTATSASISLAPKLSPFVMPEPPLTPLDTKFHPQSPSTIQAWHTRSGHVLVQPKINGQGIGYMMLDTGASGLVIEQSIADELGLSSFGEMYVAGMGGRLRCLFRRGQELTLGPVTIQRPLFMQMSLSGVVTGSPGPVIGILGYDVFRRCVMELPPSSHDSANTPFNLTLHDPATFTPTPKLDHRWQPLVMIANLPHVEVLLTVKEGDEPVKCMFMLDSGAGGVDAMFHSRAVRELGLVQDNKHGMRTLTGVGGSAVAGMKVKTGELSSIDLSDHQFHKIKCLFTDSDGLDHTLYSSGILCGDIMSRCTVILDYARSRIMFVPKNTDRPTS